MIINQDNHKQLIDFLINRWKFLIGFAAIERVYLAACHFAEKNNLSTPQKPIATIPKACRQIEIIKHSIIEILPKTQFIDYTFEAQAPLEPNDFTELFIADHQQCIAKVEIVIDKMKIK